MFGSEVLDVVIGMIFVFLLLSLVCSAVNELIESWLNKRSQFLLKGIIELLNDKDEEGKVRKDGLVAKLYEHQLIAGLFRGKYGKNAYLPSYIPARNFALALMDIVAPAGDGKKSGAEYATTPPNTAESIQNLRDGINNNVNNAEVKRALLSLVDAAGDNAAKARENIENWFDSAMDRVSGWYKRWTHVIILILGLGVTIFINADAITISNALSHDKALRDSLVASADEYAKGTLPTASPTPSPSPNPNSKIEECKKDANSPECRLKTNLATIEGLGLPIGWDRNNPKLVPPFAFNNFWNDIGAWLLKIFGWLLTAFAISLGAPFWFDLLNKFMVVRSTVKPHEKSPEDKSKDR